MINVRFSLLVPQTSLLKCQDRWISKEKAQDLEWMLDSNSVSMSCLGLSTPGSNQDLNSHWWVTMCKLLKLPFHHLKKKKKKYSCTKEKKWKNPGAADSRKTRTRLQSNKDQTSQKTGTLHDQKSDTWTVVMVTDVTDVMIKMGIKRVNNRKII